MIYLLLGNDAKAKKKYLKKLNSRDEPLFFAGSSITKAELFNLAGAVSLFGGAQSVVIDQLVKEGGESYNLADIAILKESATIFILLEEKLLAADLKKYSQGAIVERFDLPISKTSSKTNIFQITDAFANRDKIGTWILYREAILRGAAPEEISGLLFWKIKMLILNGTKIFTIEELKKRSSKLVDLYHKAHRGETDFTIGLEQFILNALSK